MVRCGYCREPMQGSRRFYKSKPLHSYYCTRGVYADDCRFNSMRCDALDDYVVCEVRKLADPEVFDNARMGHYAKRMAEIDPEMKSVRRKVADCETALRKAWDLVLADVVTTEEFRQEKEVLSARKTSLLARLADLEDEKKRIEAEERKTAELSLVLSTLETRWQSASVKEKNILPRVW